MLKFNISFSWLLLLMYISQKALRIELTQDYQLQYSQSTAKLVHQVNEFAEMSAVARYELVNFKFDFSC